MTTHRGDVSVSSCVPADAVVSRYPAGQHHVHVSVSIATRPTTVADSDRTDVVGLRLRVAIARLRSRGVDACVRVTRAHGPVGVVIGQQPGEGSVIVLDVVIGTPVRVPDVVLESEVRARARIEAAGLAPGRRIPGPRPASHCPEVVMRTHPRAGTLVQAGSKVDYELLPGEPRQLSRATDHIDHEAASSRRAPVGPVDFDAVDMPVRFGSQPVEGRA